MTPLEECVATFRRWMDLPDPGTLLVTLAAVVANLAPGDPVWLMVVGPPGGGKTETLTPLFGLPYVYPTATLTEAALLSGTPKKERSASAKGGLLREIGDFGILICKDFTSVLSMHRDARAAVLAALREIFDGAWTRHLGTGGGITLSWSGKVGMIVACTPAIDSHHSVIGSMGERFVLWRIPPVDGDAQALAALRHAGREAEMRAELTAAFAKVLESVDPSATPPLTKGDATRIQSLANLAVRCRSTVDRDPYTRDIELIPEPEAPGRLTLVLLRLRNALAVLGVDTDTAWRVLAKVALDSMPALRRDALEAVAGAAGHMTSGSAPHDVTRAGPLTGEVADTIGYPFKTTLRALEELTAHGVLTRSRSGPKNADVWTLSAWTRERWSCVPGMSGGSSTTSPNLEEDFSGKQPEKAA